MNTFLCRETLKFDSNNNYPFEMKPLGSTLARTSANNPFGGFNGGIWASNPIATLSFESTFESEANFASFNPDMLKQLRLPGQKGAQPVQRKDEASRAKPGQQLLIHKKLNKNQYFLIFEYLECNEINAFVLSCKSIYQRVFGDSYFKKLHMQSYLRFFMQQFIPSIPNYAHGNNEDLFNKGSLPGSMSHLSTADMTSLGKRTYSQFDSDQSGLVEPAVTPEHALWNQSSETTTKGRSNPTKLTIVNIEIKSISAKLHDLYLDMLSKKKAFLSDHTTDFDSQDFAIDAESFARELFLEA